MFANVSADTENLWFTSVLLLKGHASIKFLDKFIAVLSLNLGLNGEFPLELSK